MKSNHNDEIRTIPMLYKPLLSSCILNISCGTKFTFIYFFIYFSSTQLQHTIAEIIPNYLIHF